MEKAYEPSVHDSKWQKIWQDNHLGEPESDVKNHPHQNGEKFVVMMPPPNVTGVLHQGHALGISLQDVLARWHRMRGAEVLYLPGTDHASIAVQMSVARHLAEKKIDYRSLGREGFLRECWSWIETYKPRILGQIKRLGTSCDWSRLKFTMDPDLNRAVIFAFCELYRKGLIYRAERLVHWSPKGQTVLSDLEVINEERDGFIWHIRYPLVSNPNKFLIVATTRPETLLGDVAVAVHPEDTRYKSLVGQKVKLPIVEREIPIIADAFVEKDFGSGAVKITPAHDHNDFEVGVRHGLERINVFTKEASIIAGLPGEGAKYAGLERFEARKRIVSRLEELGLLEKTEKHKMRLGFSERWGDVVEPFLSTQWYLKMGEMGQRALGVVQNGSLEIIPEEFKNQYLRWLEGLKDWCVSRQLWWGQQIPAFHCQKCANFEVCESEPQKNCAKCGQKSWQQDTDVLDTWFSSGLWPFSTLGWPDKTEDLKKFYPNSVLETGFDIIFFWVARMIMFGQEFLGEAPFKKVLLHPMVRDEKGQKMSKTKGNVKDPLEIADRMGADTLRLTLNALCIQGRDLRLSDERIEGYKNFINKVWNATRFVLMDESVKDSSWQDRPKNLSHVADRWILASLDSTAREVAKCWESYRMQEAAEKIYHFFWNDFCDWYLEISKSRRQEAQPILLYVLSEALKILHPICPHFTEELYSYLPGVKSTSLLCWQKFPEGAQFPDFASMSEIKFLQDFIGAIRNLRSENKVPPSKKIRVIIPHSKEIRLSIDSVKKNSDWVKLLAKLDSLEFVEGLLAEAGNQPVSTFVVTAIEAGRTFEACVPVKDLVDVADEKLRVKKEMEQLEKLKASQESKLQNPQFVERAPKEVVDKEKIKLSEMVEKLSKIAKTLEDLNRL